LLTGCSSFNNYLEVGKKNEELTQALLQKLDAIDPEKDGFRNPLFANGIYLGMALDGQSLAFDGDINRIQDSLFFQAVNGPTILLSNLNSFPDREPHANTQTMPIIAKAAGKWLAKYEHEKHTRTLAIVGISSHGNEGLMSLHVGNERARSIISGQYISDIISSIGDSATIVIISACNSGSLLPSLRAPNRILVFSAASDRKSFGCQADSRNTIFIQEFLDVNLDENLSLKDIFNRTLERVSVIEEKMGVKASLPQIYVGDAMQNLYLSPIVGWKGLLEKSP
jgi:hypothetical protein